MDNNLYAAFIKFQGDFKGMRPDATNPFFKSTYITLDGILETVRPILAKHGLAVMQEATGDGEYIFVKTKLIHETGQILETEVLKMKPQKNDPQQLGSCITYAKRYQLAALLGICESVDDDGNKATHGNSKPSQGNTKSNKPADNKSLTDGQIKRLYTIANTKGISPDDVKKVVQHDYKKDVKDLTKVEYDELCSRIEKKPSK